ncbi:AAA domain-containing protein [Paenibacillus sp. LMG 31458]|uniref:AAA domain-containing protein n=1 Tax=Paenibacillus phytorum TaxID=2654977 RepID=A0ABX1Y1U3_9BACL|nr:AAA family ATPase [Paenibacillus phytorum]NOU73988.1 AAA domain-containing protein [Paenibacillus phytorum]
MPANRQGEFTEIHHNFFGSVEGGFTAITSQEINQVTFNVKVSIRNVLIKRLGEGNIARTGNGISPDMLFHIWPGTEGIAASGDRTFPCKFGKPQGNEMTAYFSRIVPKERMSDGDIWFVFFRDGDVTPWFGLMKENVWDHFFSGSNMRVEDTSGIRESVPTFGAEVTEHVTGGSNLILYGAPGTGKSFELEKRANTNVTRVTFHSEYTYYDFVGSYKPVPIYSKEIMDFISADGGPIETGQPYIDYQFVPGPFAIILRDALLCPYEMHTLKIEELNRANAASVFGDLFQLLDRRENGESEYRITPTKELYNYLKKNVPNLGNEIYIPANLNIFATMNSADQGVFVMDSAFKRRWNFEYMAIKLRGIKHENEPVQYENGNISWSSFVENINERLAEIKINEDKHIGPYFMKSGEPSNRSKIASKLLVYLWDDVVRHNRNQFFLDEYKTFAQLVKAYEADKKIFVFNINTQEEDVEEERTEELSGVVDVHEELMGLTNEK